jgi:hypothetical protein
MSRTCQRILRWRGYMMGTSSRYDTASLRSKRKVQMFGGGGQGILDFEYDIRLDTVLQ